MNTVNDVLTTYENAPKLTRGGINGNIDSKKDDYRRTPTYQSYQDIMVTYRPNCYSSERSLVTLREALEQSTHPEHIKKCKSAASYMYYYDPIGEDQDDDFLLFPEFDKENTEMYKELRRERPVIQYSARLTSQSGIIEHNPMVILDIDLKMLLGTLTYSELLEINRKLMVYFTESSSTVFISKSSSGIGYHIGYAFETNNFNRISYANAFHYFIRDLINESGISDLEYCVDMSVGTPNHDFFLGQNEQVFIKQPELCYYYCYEEPDKTVNETAKTSLGLLKDDFKLYLAYKNRQLTRSYFDDWRDWTLMAIALRIVYAYSYERALYWFIELSSLSEKFDYDNDILQFEALFDQEFRSDIGINYILSKLSSEEPISSYPMYTLADVEDYFNNEMPAFKFGESNGNLLIDRYINEISEDIDTKKNLIVVSPPNTGKSTHFLRLKDQKTIFLVPTQILRDDLQKKRPDALVLKAGDLIDGNSSHHSTLIGTYDSIWKLDNSALNLSDYTLIIDEAHELFCSSSIGFRYSVMRKLVDSFSLFNNVILLSGTWIDFPISNTKFEKVEVSKNTPDEPQLEVVVTNSPLNTMVEEIIAEKSKQICLVNNKSLNQEICDSILKRDPHRRVIIVNRDKLGEQEVKELFHTNSLPEGTVLIGTQMIREGISFNDSDITHLRFYEPMLPEHIAQFSFRCRDLASPPKMVMYIKKVDFRYQDRADPASAYDACKRRNTDLLNQVFSLPRELMEDLNIMSYCVQANGKSVETPIINYVGAEPHIDLLLLGNIVLKDVESSLSRDLLSLLGQLKKWGFIFSFRGGNESNILNLQRRESLQRQRDIIRNDLNQIDGIPESKISKRLRLLYRAWCVTQFLDFSYFDNLIAEERLKFFTDKKSLESLVTKVGVMAIQKGKYSEPLQYLIDQLKLAEDINVVVEATKIKGFPKLHHNLLTEHYRIDSSKIKTLKKILQRYYKIVKSGTNKDRFFIVEPDAEDIANHIKWSAFDDASKVTFW